MISRRGKVLLFLYAIFLAALFLMCSTDWIIREPEKEVYQIAVIIDEDKSDNYTNFRKGMDQAAAELNADVHFITLYKKLDVEQQIGLMEREREDGADALIVIPVKEGQVVAETSAVPVTLLHPAPSNEAGGIVVDYRKMGERIAQEMQKDMPKGSTVLLLTASGKWGVADQLFLEGARETFGVGENVRQAVWKEGEAGFLAVLDGLGLQEGEKTAVLAQNPEVLSAAAGILAESQEVAGRILGLYGRGSTVQILNYLDRGQIRGVCVTDGFGIGYLSVCEAVRELEGNGKKEALVMDSYYIEKEDLREEFFERMLFPVE